MYPSTHSATYQPSYFNRPTYANMYHLQFLSERQPHVQPARQTDVYTAAHLRQDIEASQQSGVSQLQILQNWLRIRLLSWTNITAANSLRNAIIVGLDIEWYEHNSRYITELGVSVLDPLRVQDWTSAWSVLQTLHTQHVRIQANAHLINSELCAGHPEKFQFGKTSFVTSRGATTLLRHSFTHFDQHGQLRPVIFLGHAVENDVKMIKERFGFDLEALGSIVATVDTQILAVDTGRAPPGRPKKLTDLLSSFGVRELYLHNAGNDIVCTFLAAMMMAIPNRSYSDAVHYQDFKKDLQRAHRIEYGTTTFCVKCSSDGHVEKDCTSSFYCTHCASDPSRSKAAYSHRLDKCVERAKDLTHKSRAHQHRRNTSLIYALPCQFCIESTDPQRHKLVAAYGHLTENCVFGPPPATENP